MTQSAKTKLRSCVVCGKKDSKGQLMRVVRATDGAVRFDASSKAAGRGAYVCSLACLQNAMKTRKLERALRTKLDKQAYDRIEADVVSALRQSQGIVEE